MADRKRQPQTPGPPVEFVVPPVNVVTDLHGDPGARLVVLLNGNQWMVLPDLLASFTAAHPDHGDLFVETLPPGILVAQVRHGALQMGSLRLSVRPDVLAAAPGVLEQLHGEGLVDAPVRYASNDLALLVAPGNPLGITDWPDLARPEVRVAMPDPAIEGVGELIARALTAAGGVKLRERVMTTGADRGTTRYTRIHHRQSPAWIDAEEVDVAPVWTTEARTHDPAGVQTVSLPPASNITGHYAAARVRAGTNPAGATAFLQHLTSPPGQEVYRSHGFAGPIGDRGDT